MLSDELHGEIVLRQVDLTPQSPMNGRAIEDFEEERLSVNVIALRRGQGDVQFMLGRDVQFLEGDQIVALGTPGVLDKVAGTQSIAGS